MNSLSYYDKFNKFAEEHSILARVAAPAVALYEGIKWSFGVPLAALDHATDAIALATFQKKPTKTHKPTSRDTYTLIASHRILSYLSRGLSTYRSSSGNR